MTTHEDRDHDIETPAQYRDRMARESLAGAELCTAEDDCEEDDDDDELGDEYEEPAAAEESAIAAEEPAAGKSSAELATLRPSKDEDGYAFNHPSLPMAVLPIGPKAMDAVKAETETLLNGLIGECGSLLRDVAFRSACLTPDGGERIRFISAAESLVLTATKVADAIGRLRHGEPQVVDAHRHELVYTHVHTTPPSPRSAARGDNQ